MDKLILAQEVTGLGSAGDVVEVKGGYARNFLVPRGLAIRWTRGGEKQVAAIRRGRETREVRDLDEAERIKTQLETMTVRVEARSGKSGRLFGGVTVADIAAAVPRTGGPELDKRRIEIGTPIKSVGAHQATVRIHPEVTATLRVEVKGS